MFQLMMSAADEACSAQKQYHLTIYLDLAHGTSVRCLLTILKPPVWHSFQAARRSFQRNLKRKESKNHGLYAFFQALKDGA